MIDFKELLKSGAHFGHKTSFGNPKMRPYIWGAKNRIHLIDVSKTAALIEFAGKKLTELSSSGKSVLWVGTKKPSRGVIAKVSKELNMPFVINRWIGGTLSNYAQVKKAITRLLHLRDIVKKSAETHYTKKEVVMLQKQLARLEKNVGGIIDLEFPPAAIVVVDAKKEHSAVKEAFGMKIPVIAIVDTNTDPSFVDFVIPANDDSPRSIRLIVEYLAKAVAEGKTIAEKEKKEKAATKEETKKEVKKVVAKKPVPKKVVKKIEKKPAAKKVVKKTTTKKVVKKTTKKKASAKK
jgi:small subunit ribosomal protein S2